MDLEEKLSNLSIFYNKEEIILLTAAQIQKDLLQFNLEYIIDPELINFDTLFEALNPIVTKLLNTNKEKLVQLFYRIDVSEHKIAKSFEEKSIEKTCIKISKLIINRELKKVIIRKHYK